MKDEWEWGMKALARPSERASEPELTATVRLRSWIDRGSPSFDTTKRLTALTTLIIGDCGGATRWLRSRSRGAADAESEPRLMVMTQTREARRFLITLQKVSVTDRSIWRAPSAEE